MYTAQTHTHFVAIVERILMQNGTGDLWVLKRSVSSTFAVTPNSPNEVWNQLRDQEL